MQKYHVALSFAGEDREYVEAVAKELQRAGVRVFYDKFEDVELWGKDLYVHFTDVYQKQAMYTVLFVSKAYRDKLWTNHERKAAQARAIAENKEYILPAVFDSTIEIPGVLKTTGYINLKKLTPQAFAKKIVKKLQDDKVFLVQGKFTYSAEAKADVDFPLPADGKVAKIVDDLRSHTWPTQNRAIEKIFGLNWALVSPDEAFVLGRNMYQFACGNEFRAVAILKNLRQELARFPLGVAEHLLNGMFYEVYFDSKGEFRGRELKSRCVTDLFALQTVEKYKDCIAFISQVLLPFRESVLVVPNARPEVIEVTVKITKQKPPVVKSLECLGRQVLVNSASDRDLSLGQLWKLSFKGFTLETLAESLAEAWAIPFDQLKVLVLPKLDMDTEISLPKGMTICHPISNAGV